MAKLLSVLLCALGLAAPASAGDGCPFALNTGAVGSCMTSDCASSRGPTVCTLGTCFCEAGFCRYPASTLHIEARYCVQRVPDSTCHLTRVCYAGGLSETFCEKGLCMCKWGYRYDEDSGKCESAPAFLPAGGNMTAADLEFLQQQERGARLNALGFCGWLAGAAAAAAAITTIAVRKFRVQEVSGYEPLLACE